MLAGRRPDPEVQAGRALRRLRLSRSWSQEEVARRMSAYGYDFHQTTIAKIEAAQRPLRVRELADFAALYGVEVQALVYPPNDSLLEIAQELGEVQAMLAKARTEAERAHDRMQMATAAYQASAAEAAVLEGRLAALRAERDELARQEAREDSPPA